MVFLGGTLSEQHLRIRGAFSIYKEIVIVGAVRTSSGRYCGALREFDYYELGALPIRELLVRAHLPVDAIDEVWWGVGDTSVCKDVYTPVVARQTLLKAGLPAETPSVSLEKADDVRRKYLEV